MRLSRFTDAAQFLSHAEEFLVRHEAENCVMLAIANQLRLYPDRVEQPPYLAVAEDARGVQAAALMTPPHKLLLSVTESREALSALAADVRDFYPAIRDVNGQRLVSQWFAEIWHEQTGDAFELSMVERLYRLTQVTWPAGVAGAARRAGGSDRDLLIEWGAAFDLEAFGTLSDDTAARVDNFLEMSTRGLFLWYGPDPHGQPVSMAGTGGMTPHSARIGPVYTPPQFRGHGYASALTAWLSQYLLDSGRQFCTLFTNLANPTSNHIYQTIGYLPVGDVADCEFKTAVP